MKENKANPKSKWCPMARVDVGGEGVAAVNRRPLAGHVTADRDEWLNARCLGSACAVFVTDRLSDDPDEGHCGLIRR